MNKSINELGEDNVLATQSQDEQKQTESVSENEESESVTDQTSSSSSETTNTQNSLPKTSNSKRKSNSTSTKSSTVTQFSVERSDVDGLRMKISAIRPSNTVSNTISNTKQPSQTAAAPKNQDFSGESSEKTRTQISSDKDRVLYNNNSLTKPLTVKLSNIKLQQHSTQPAISSIESTRARSTTATAERQTSRSSANKMSVDVVQQTFGAESSGVTGASENTHLAETSANVTSVAPTVIAAPPIELPLAKFLPQALCFSDATAESGCSEATTTTIAACAEKTFSKRVRVKRKKAQSKQSHDYKKPALSAAASVIKSIQTHQQHNFMTYSTDSEDDASMQKQQQQQKLQKRAPRLLLTAINTNSTNEPQIKPLAISSVSALPAGSATFSHGSDNSDNELKLDDVVNAVIKRVESDGDDTPTGPEGYRKTRTKRLPQYQSTLLQDFMEKTQMLGSSSTSTTVEAQNLELDQSKETNLSAPKKSKVTSDLIAHFNSTNSQTHSIASSGAAVVTNIVKKKRGRPKKPTFTPASNTIPLNAVTGTPTPVITATSAATAAAVSSIAININESADSGVISTTSTTTTQSSTSPSPKLSCAISSGSSSTLRLTATTPSQKRRNRTLEPSESTRQPSVSPCKSQTQDGSGSCSANSPKPKIDIAYLDKRMYAATERVLYPPPRNKRRQSVSASSVIPANTPTNKNAGKSPATSTGGNTIGIPGTPVSAKPPTKEELQLDPVWRKIDVNKKFRRPSVGGYKSDGGGGNTTICSKILAAKSGYVSDYGSFHARAPRDHSGYKSDVSGKSRYSVKSCASRRSRAKSCGYRSDYKDGKDATSLKSKYRRKRRSMLMRAHSRSVGNLATNLNDVEKDILQLAGLSLGQSSEESNEYVCKPNLESLPTTSASKKYGEINRFIATGEYFGRGSSHSTLTSKGNLFSGSLHDNADGSGSHDGYGFSRKLLLQRKHSSVAVAGAAHDMLLPHAHSSRKIKSRRSSVASYCSSYYSTMSKVRRRRRRKSFLRFPSSGKSGAIIDSKLLTEIDILTNTFSTRCRIQSGAVGGEKATSSNKDKVPAESGGGKMQTSNSASISGSLGKREQRDKRSLKKRKMSENQEHGLLSVSAGGNGSGGGFGGSTMASGSGSGAKRRHKKANSSSSPDDHKLPLKKRHYLLTPGEKSTEAAAAAAVAAKLFGSTAVEAWAAAVASSKLASAGKAQHSQQQFGALCGSTASVSVAGSTHSGSTKSSKTGVTPKKRQFTQQEEGREAAGNTSKGNGSHNSNSSPLRIAIDNTLSQKLLDISPLSVAGSTKQSDVVHRKRSRLEVLVSKIVATTSNTQSQAGGKQSPTTMPTKPKQTASGTHLNQQHSNGTPPPGVFEPSVALEIQIPPIVKLSETSSGGVSSVPPVVTKSEVNSPLLLQDLASPAVAASMAKTESTSTRVVETLLSKTGAANLMLKRKRKKINRTGFPNVRRRKKRNISEQMLLDIVENVVERTLPMKRRPRVHVKQNTQTPAAPVRSSESITAAPTTAPAATKAPTTPAAVLATTEKPCDRVPVSGEASDSFLERANRTPRLSVVALERLRGTPTPTTSVAAATVAAPTLVSAASTPSEVVEEHKENSFLSRKGRVGRKPKNIGNPTKRVNDGPQCTKGEQSVDTSTKAAEHAEIATRKSVRTSTPSAGVELADVVTSTKLAPAGPATPKSTKRTKAVEPATEATKIKPAGGEPIQLLVDTNNALPRARGRKSKLAAAATLTTTASKITQLTSDENQKKLKAAAPERNKEPSAPLVKQTRKSATTTSSVLKTSEHPASFSKSTVHKIITAKSLEAKVKLPAGIDPNTNFSCKIRLKRPSTAKSQLVNAHRQSMDSNGDGSSIKDVPQSTPEQIAVEAAAKDSNIDYLEQNILPRSETPFIESEAATSDTSDEKCSTTTSTSASNVSASAVRKVARLKKNYLVAGLFSDYFKALHSTIGARKEKKDAAHTPVAVELECSAESNNNVSSRTSVPVAPSLPPPPYCEQYFRRTQVDFELPYDIWWAYTNSKLPTRITVPSWNYRKIRTNIYADAVRPNLAGLDHPTCNCKPDQGCGDNCLNRMVYTECSPSSCPARDKCRNQKIQRHDVAPGVERFMTTDKGWGVRTKLPIKKGTYILEYVGEVVTEREFKDRMGTIYLNDTHHYCLHLDGGLVIDGHRMGSDGRFVNHSCQPNCEMQKWSVNGLSRMALFAKRNIEPGEEISYDYNFSLFNPSEGQPCRCNTPQCRGVIGGKSQRVKPLPIEAKPAEPAQEDAPSCRQRKRKAHKNIERILSKDVVVARVQQISEKEKKLVKQHGIFLVRNFEKIRRCKARRSANSTSEPKLNGISITPPTTPITSCSPTVTNTVAAITTRRSSTPPSLAAQISALRSPRSIKTRGLTHAVQDPEVEKMAKIAVILRDICAFLEMLKDPKNEKQTLATLALTNAAPSANKVGGGDAGGISDSASSSNVCGTSKKKRALKASQKYTAISLKMVQSNVEQGYYKLPSEFNADMQKVFTAAQDHVTKGGRQEAALKELITVYERIKQESYARLLEIVGGDETILMGFCDRNISTSSPKVKEENPKVLPYVAGMPHHAAVGDITTSIITPTTSGEDIIRCICGLYKDEGLMIQCARCMVWQHTECTKADVNADNYLCERCEPRIVDREIPLDDYTEEGHRYYLTLMRGDLHVRQSDAVYVLRDIPVKDASGSVVPTQKHTYETIGNIDYNECDIFRVERLWKNEEGKRFIFGHHFLRPHETFHEPSRRFYPNEVVRVPLYEIVPIELVIGRCWVLDRTTFCKGRPVECTDEKHCYICELRVDKTARFFSKARVNYPTCTKTYAFRKFPEKRKISKSYAPHDVDPALLKPKRQKTDIETETNTRTSATRSVTPVPPTSATEEPQASAAASRPNSNKTPQSVGRKRRHSSSPATVHLICPIPPSVQTIKQKRTRLETVLKAMKLRWKNAHGVGTEQPIDLSYLLSGRGARQRKTQVPAANNSAAASSTSLTSTTSSTSKAST
ncbi:histone-lysine N-methyltransferase ash1 [Rhagoletis pomonella]|uniref:histone-lysine N-methyltransferase ash1 n=1 Tax=Rhagoletis pomonella TaxID=28610 RepID=UPI00177B8602|nr:histone-lysine N-methyltransferase ash1 [Rhagoletis pomonella]XP_036326150.1 histone-lysine N-methyltransferase ash1 [Rhagoletis pomonella]XP_036326151.1 histone-lysine N-methyltransferase ash1 [Rhagoletis pomonella]